MKKIITILLTTAALISIYVDSGSTIAKPPLERTGAPDETYCTDCHSGTPLNGGGGSMSIVFSGANNKYKPGKTYFITVTVTDAAQSVRGGFETTILDQNNLPAGTNFIINPDNTMLRLDPNNGRYYVTNYQGPPYTTWTYKWKAPASSVGNITIYCATNASNDDFTPSGDHIYASTLVIKPKPVMKEGSFSMEQDDFSVYPTLVQKEFHAKYFAEDAGHVQMLLLNMNGEIQEVLADEQVEAGAYEPSFNLTKNYAPGIYLVAFKMNDEMEMQKIVIQ
jgi:hypothetical protein